MHPEPAKALGERHKAIGAGLDRRRGLLLSSFGDGSDDLGEKGANCAPHRRLDRL